MGCKEGDFLSLIDSLEFYTGLIASILHSNFIYCFFWASLGLRCCMRGLPLSFSEQGCFLVAELQTPEQELSSCGTWA